MQQIFDWLKGEGWLVFSGGDDAMSTIRTAALARLKEADGGVAYISLRPDGGEAMLDDMEDLGAPTGYIINPASDEPATLHKLLHEASLIAIQSDESLDELQRVLEGGVLEGIRSGYERGAVILLEDLATSVFGRFFITDGGQMGDGFNWVTNVFILPGITSLQDSEMAQTILTHMPDAVVIGIGVGSALALGPGGQIETWGEQQITVALGQRYTS